MKINKCKVCKKPAEHYNPDYKDYFCIKHYVESMDKEGIEASLYHDYIQDEPKILRQIKKQHPDLYKKYPNPFKRNNL